jgi:hypothetical protein
MSYFSLAHESADSTDTLANDVSAQPNTLQASDAGLQEAATESHDVMEAEGKAVDLLQDGEDKVQDIKEEVVSATEADGLSPQALKYLQVSLRNIVGKSFANKRLPSMEAAEKEDPHSVARIALEGVVDTIKQFWLAIKNQVGKFWNATKDWYIKTFDVANKIIARAKALSEKTNSMTSSPTEKSFSMGGASLLAVNYSVKDPNACIKGLASLKTILDTILINVTKQNQNDKADRILNSVSKLTHASRSNLAQGNANLPRIYTESQLDKAMQGAFIEDAPTYPDLAKITIDAEMAKKLGIDTQTTSARMSDPLPGNKSFFVIGPSDTNKALNTEPKSIEELTGLFEQIKLFRWLVSDTSSKTKTMDEELDVKTLMSGQVDQIAGLCEEMGTTILKYKKEFEMRDKYIQRVVKGFDTIMKELEQELDHAKGGAETKADQLNSMTQTNYDDYKKSDADHKAAQKAGDNAAADQALAQRNADFDNMKKINNASSVSSNPQTQAKNDQKFEALKSDKSTDQIDKCVRKLAQSLLGLFKKNMTISGAVVSHTTKVCNIFLSYGEKSAAQYGSA